MEEVRIGRKRGQLERNELGRLAECLCGCGCVGIIAWVVRAVCGWGSLDCCSVCVCVCVCVRVCVCDCVGVGVFVWVGVGVITWVRKGVCGWKSLDCCLKVCTLYMYMYVCVGERRRGECVCVWVGWCGCVDVGVMV